LAFIGTGARYGDRGTPRAREASWRRPTGYAVPIISAIRTWSASPSRPRETTPGGRSRRSTV